MHVTTKPAHVESTAVTLAVDQAKDVFEPTFSDVASRIAELSSSSAARFPSTSKTSAP